MIWHRGYANGMVDVAMLDVMGHGQAAGVLETQLSTMLDEITLAEHSPPEVVAMLNKAMRQVVDPVSATFATGLMLRVDVHGRELAACNFGHEGPIFSRAGQVGMEHGPPIGLDADIDDWPQVVLRFAEHGDRFLVFTDGVPEQFDVDGRRFTVAGLERVFREHLNRSLSHMMDGIVQAVEVFRGSSMMGLVDEEGTLRIISQPPDGDVRHLPMVLTIRRIERDEQPEDGSSQAE